MKQKKYFINRLNIRNESAGLVNSSINQLPLELHTPGYNYCGPGTKLQSLLARNDLGINPLDETYKVQNISYAISSLLEDRYKSDKILGKVASQRLFYQRLL